MKLGSLSIRREAVLWSRAQADGYLTIAAVGLLAGMVVAYARMPLHLPGHKALWWIPPVLAARLLTRRQAGASVGASATIATTLSLGGHLAGGVIAVPLVMLAGVTLDMAAMAAERRPAAKWRVLPLLSSGGAAANLVCFAKRLFEPAGPFSSTSNVQDLLWAAVSYASFGVLAGTLGAAMAYAILTFRMRHEKPGSPTSAGN